MCVYCSLLLAEEATHHALLSLLYYLGLGGVGPDLAELGLFLLSQGHHG